MYIPKHFDMPELDRQLAFVRAHSFASVISHVDGELFATHVPVRVQQEAESDRVVATFHFAKANAHAAALAVDPKALLIFTGPHAYVAASVYDKLETVPTWNYVAVHVSGSATVIEEKSEKLALLADLIGHYEAAFQFQWDALSDKYRDGMLAGIVAFRVVVDKIEGKAKLSQNQSENNRARIADWLADHAHETPRAVSALMRRP